MEFTNTKPKTFVFVLMPFDAEFKNIYEVGIKDAATAVGAYAERVSDQKYSISIVEQIHNQINKADVIVADMTGRNPNVFYEVGYAHALGGVVLLLTRDIDDIPFDLKHRYHIKYDADDLGALRADLTEWLRWAIPESKKREDQRVIGSCKITLKGVPIPEIRQLTDSLPVVEHSYQKYLGYETSGHLDFDMTVVVENTSEVHQHITHILLFSTPGNISPKPRGVHMLGPQTIPPRLNDNSPVHLTERHQLDIRLPPVSSSDKEEFQLKFSLPFDKKVPQLEEERVFALKMWVGNVPLLFPFRLKANFKLSFSEPALSPPPINVQSYNFRPLSRDEPLKDKK